MTKAELAAARGASMASVNRLVRRRRLERQPGADGLTRVLVPRQWAEGKASADAAEERRAPETAADSGAPPERGGAVQEQIARLRAEIDSLSAARQQAERERDQERQAREAAERDLAEARRQAEEATQAAGSLRQAKERHAAEERAEEVTREVTAAQLRRLTESLAARRSLGLWARLRLAWRGD